MLDAEQTCDRAGHEPVGGGDDRQRVALGSVFIEQCVCTARDHRAYARLKIFGVQPIQLGTAEASQRGDGERDELVNVERAFCVIAVVTLVSTSMCFRIYQAFVDDELAPGVVAVPGKQGM